VDVNGHLETSIKMDRGDTRRLMGRRDATWRPAIQPASAKSGEIILT